MGISTDFRHTSGSAKLGRQKRVFDICLVLCPDFCIKTEWRESPVKFPSYVLVIVRKSRHVDLIFFYKVNFRAAEHGHISGMILARPRAILPRRKAT